MADTAVVSRENIEEWGPRSQKLRLFRRALEEMQNISDAALMDERGYQWVAGVHGGFGGLPFCQHRNANFPTWHRAYLLDIELKLRAQIARIADQPTADEWRIPYWDWTTPGAGIPQAFLDRTYVDDGVEKPNPLFSAPYNLGLPIGDEVLQGRPTDRTWRGDVQPGAFDDLGQMVADSVDEPSYNTFWRTIEGPHNQIHNRVSGFMATFRSSFDPIFWVHHANVDRQFWQWQQNNGGLGILPQSVLEFECQPFDFLDIRAGAFLDTRPLGYTYATARSPVVLHEGALENAAANALPLDFGRIPAGFSSARLNLHNVRHTEETVELRFFADRGRPPDAATATTPAENFLASEVLLGHGPCPGAPGHCDPEPEPITGAALRGRHHLTPFDLLIPITRPLRALLGEGAGTDDLRAYMIIVGQRGELLDPAAVSFDNATVTVS